MMTISIYIQFKNQDSIDLHTGSWFESTLKHWKLNSSDIFYKYIFEWTYILECRYKLSAEEFLELVGSNEQEALEIICTDNDYLTKEKAQEYITPTVKEFYKELENTELLYVDVKLVDQS